MDITSQRRSRLRVHSGEPSAELGHVHVGGPRDVRVLAPSARLGDGRIEVLFAIVFKRTDIDPANSTFTAWLWRAHDGTTVHPSGQSVTMEVDRVGIQVSFPLDSDSLRDPLVLRLTGPLLGEDPVEFGLVLDHS